MMALNMTALNDINGAKYHLEQCLNINPDNSYAIRAYYHHFGVNYAPKIKNMKKHLYFRGRHARGKRLAWTGSNKEFQIFWYDKLNMWLYDETFQQYYEYFVQNKKNNIQLLFLICLSELKNIIGITNKEHIEIIMNAINKHIIIEHDKFKQWLATIIFNKRLVNQFCETMLNNVQPIYSFESFYRNVSSENKLKGILGARYFNLIKAIWSSYHE
eukprot:508476_1